jgi:deazaflavin-dependent oxidoreductase (nitroreductase family)
MTTLERTAPPATATIFTLPDPNGIQRVFYRLPLLAYRLGFGGMMDRLRIAALTTRGRSSGKARFAALEYRQHGSKVYILSGWGEQANWVRNLEHAPQVTLRRGARVQAGLAAIVRDRSEVFRALTLFYRSNPAYYERIFKRAGQRDSLDALSLPQLANRIIVVRVDPLSTPPVLPAAPVDAQAVTAVVAGLLTVGLVLAPIALAARAVRRSR